MTDQETTSSRRPVLALVEIDDTEIVQQINMEVTVKMTLNSRAAILVAARIHQDKIKDEISRLRMLLEADMMEAKHNLLATKLQMAEVELEELQEGISQLWHTKNHRGNIK